MNRDGGPGGREAVAQGEAETATQQPVKAHNEWQRQDHRQRRWQTGEGGVTRCNITTSQDG